MLIMLIYWAEAYIL